MAIVWDDEKSNPDNNIKWDDKSDTKEPMPLSKVASEAFSNVPSSAVSFGKNLAEPFIHPVNTVNNLRDVLFGGLGKVIPGADVGDQQSKFDALRSALAERYGGYENIKRTIASDPVGSMADAATVLTGGGGIAARLPGVAGKVGSAINTVGRAIEPINATKQTVGRAIGSMSGDLPLRLYESALKPAIPNKKFTRADQLETLQAGLDAGIAPTQFGIDKLEGIIDDLNNQITTKIDTGAANGLKISRDDMLKRLDDTDAFFSNMPNPEPYLKAIDEVRQGMTSSKSAYIPIDKVQKMKQTIYKVIGDSYGELSAATKEANKAIARGAKEELVNIFPEIKELNNKESLMLRLEPLVEKASGRIAKRDLMGIGTPIAGSSVAAVSTPNIGRTAAVVKAVLDDPSVKAYLAIALNKAKKGGMGPGFVEERLSAYLVGKMNETEKAGGNE